MRRCGTNSRQYAESKEALRFANTLSKKGKPFANGSSKLKESLKGLAKSKEHKKKIGKSVSKALKGKPLSEELKKKISSALKNKKVSEETREKMRISASKAQFGRIRSEEEKQKRAVTNYNNRERNASISSKAGKSQKTRTCPHCNRSGKGGGFNRWHFENCKTLNN